MEKPNLRLPAILLFPSFALYVVTLTFYNIFAADAVLQDTLWLDIFDGLQQWLEIFCIALCFAFLIAAVYRFTLRRCRNLIVLTVLALLFKYVAITVSLILFAGASFDSDTLLGNLLSFLIEILACGVVTFYVAVKCNREQQKNSALVGAARVAGKEVNIPSQLPFRKWFEKINILQSTALYSMILIAAVRLLLYLYNGVFLLLQFGIGFDPIEIPYCFLLILLPCFAAYFLMLPVISRFGQAETYEHLGKKEM